jgi:hypothetical protein
MTLDFYRTNRTRRCWTTGYPLRVRMISVTRTFNPAGEGALPVAGVRPQTFGRKAIHGNFIFKSHYFTRT